MPEIVTSATAGPATMGAMRQRRRCQVECHSALAWEGRMKSQPNTSAKGKPKASAAMT